jgi:serine/threonine protein kinase
MPDPRSSEQAIFEEAVEKSSPAERAAFLDRACGDDPDLRREVEALLAVHDRLGGPPPPGAAVDEPAGERPGDVIGPYKLLQQIGEGGMGTVFMAEQTEPVHRKVALKVVKPGMDSRQVVARFEAERQALALMDHPNIARVLDAGATASGRPYFVMELVKGVPITRYCDERRLTPRQRLELFAPVCQAVQHAHTKGIIHRDLKPSNVLVALYDGRPAPKVIDFGVAKATGQKLTDRTLFTEFGAVVGTLEYMSPEQAELNQLDIDTRSDVYSLGVLLYELLTGTTPFERKRLKNASLLEMLRVIREQEPPRPSTRLSTAEGLPAIAANRGLEPRKLSGVLRGELDWIVMKCLEKDRNRRYETANGLARDVQRYLADEPVQACPPSWSYQVGKFLRRHRLAFAAAATAAAALVLAVVALLVSNSLIRAEHEQTRREYQRAEKQRAQAAVVIKFLTVDLLGEASPEKNSRDKQVTVEELLDRAARKIENNPQMADQPEVEATIRLAIGDTYFKLGVLAEAQKHLSRAVELRRSALGPEHPDTLAAQEALAWFLVGGLRRPADAEPLSRQTWEARRRVLGADHPDTLDSMDTYASVLVALDRLDEAEPLMRECWEKRRSALGPEHEQTLITMGNLGHLLNEQGKWADAEPLLRQLRDVHRRAGRLETEGGLGTTNNLAVALMMLGPLEEAEALLCDAREAAVRSHGPKHPFTLHLQHMLTRVIFEEGRLDDARKLGAETLELRREVLPPGHQNTGRSLLLLGAIAVEAGRPAEAEPLLREALTLFREARPAKKELVGEAENCLGTCLAARGRFDEAEPLLTGGYEQMAAARVVGPRQRERALARVVRLYEDWKKPQQAAEWRRKQGAAAAADGGPKR